MSNTNTDRWGRIWMALAVIWTILLCFAPDPRPLATPAWTINGVRSLLGVQEPAARVIAAIGLRMILLGILGALLMFATGTRRFDRRSLMMMVLAPAVGIGTLWVNHRYFPIPGQLKLAVVAVCAGALLALLLRRNWIAGGALLALLAFAYLTLTGYSVEDDLDRATRAQVKHLLIEAPSVPDGDEGFLKLNKIAFALAAERSASGDPVLEDQAAILGLALVLGDEKLANVADRRIDPSNVAKCDTLRARITIHGREDWSRHFWVSAGLVVLSGKSRSLSVGVVKELKDANPGGSGFSFGDLTADAAGQLFALATTRDVPAALAMQGRMQGSLVSADLMPDPRDLPEGIYADEFEQRYGGAGGARTDSLVTVIRERLDGCTLLR